MEDAFHLEQHWRNAGDLRRHVNRLGKPGPMTFKNSLSPYGQRAGKLAQASRNCLIRQLDALFLEYCGRSHQSVSENDLQSQLFVVLLKKWLCCARQFEEVK